MGQAEKFVKGMSVYANIWVTEQGKHGPRRVVVDRLHQQYGRCLVAGDNITEQLVRLTYATKDAELTGQTIVAKAKETDREAKKCIVSCRLQ